MELHESHLIFFLYQISDIELQFDFPSKHDCGNDLLGQKPLSIFTHPLQLLNEHLTIYIFIIGGIPDQVLLHILKRGDRCLPNSIIFGLTGNLSATGGQSHPYGILGFLKLSG